MRGTFRIFTVSGDYLTLETEKVYFHRVKEGGRKAQVTIVIRGLPEEAPVVRGTLSPVP